MERKTVNVVAAMIEQNGRLLICRRPEGKALAGMWEFAGGKIEPGETPEQALVRECREELGITVAPQSLFAQVEFDYPAMHLSMQVYTAVITDGTPKRLEHMDIRWILPGELDGFTFCPADRGILDKITAEWGNESCS